MHLAGVPPKLIDAPLLLLHELERFLHATNDGGSEGSRKNQTPGAVFQIFDHLSISSHETTHGAEGLRERAHSDIHLVLNAKVIRCSATLMAKNAQRVGLIHINKGAMALRHRDDFRQVGDVARHAENAIENDQATGLLRHTLETVFQGCSGVVAERNKLCGSKLTTIDDAGVVLAVAKDGVSLLCERDQSALVGKESRGKKNGGITAKKTRNGLLKLHM